MVVEMAYSQMELMEHIQKGLQRRMSEHSNPHAIAQEGLKMLEDAVLRLLSAHPRGLRNADVAENLGLRSSFRGRQKDYLTYSVLGGLLDQGKVSWDQQTKRFTKLP